MTIRRFSASQQLRPALIQPSQEHRRGRRGRVLAAPRPSGSGDPEGAGELCVAGGAPAEATAPAVPGETQRTSPEAQDMGPRSAGLGRASGGLIPARPGLSEEEGSKRRLTWSPAGPPPPSRFPVFPSLAQQL